MHIVITGVRIRKKNLKNRTDDAGYHQIRPKTDIYIYVVFVFFCFLVVPRRFLKKICPRDGVRVYSTEITRERNRERQTKKKNRLNSDRDGALGLRSSRRPDPRAINQSRGVVAGVCACACVDRSIILNAACPVVRVRYSR